MGMSKKQRLVGGLIAFITGRDAAQKKLDQQDVQNQQNQQQVDISQQRADDTGSYYEFQRERAQREEERKKRFEQDPVPKGYSKFGGKLVRNPDPPAPNVKSQFDPETGRERKVILDPETGEFVPFGGTKALPAKSQRTAQRDGTIYPVPDIIPEEGFTIPGGTKKNAPPAPLVDALSQFLSEGRMNDTQPGPVGASGKAGKPIPFFSKDDVDAIKKVLNGKGSKAQKNIVAGILAAPGGDDLLPAEQYEEVLFWLTGTVQQKPLTSENPLLRGGGTGAVPAGILPASTAPRQDPLGIF